MSTFWGTVLSSYGACHGVGSGGPAAKTSERKAEVDICPGDGETSESCSTLLSQLNNPPPPAAVADSKDPLIRPCVIGREVGGTLFLPNELSRRIRCAVLAYQMN